MHEAMDTRDFHYVTVLRDSLARYKSHFRHVRGLFGASLMKGETFLQWMTGQPDNWIVRHICGPRCWNVPKFRLSKADLEYTLARLARFGDVLFLERYAETYARFANKFGWKSNLVHVNRCQGCSRGATVSDLAEERGWTAQDREYLAAMTTLDGALYGYAATPPQMRNSTYLGAWSAAVDNAVRQGAAFATPHNLSNHRYAYARPDTGTYHNKLACGGKCSKFR
eukprot:g6916.t1